MMRVGLYITREAIARTGPPLETESYPAASEDEFPLGKGGESCALITCLFADTSLSSANACLSIPTTLKMIIP